MYYIQHIQGLCQFRLSIADHALLLVVNYIAYALYFRNIGTDRTENAAS
jgi:hypothetical protein